MRRIWTILLCAALVLGLFSGCEKVQGPYEPTGGGLSDSDATVKPTTPKDPDTQLSLVYNPNAPINPYQCSDQTNRVLFSLMYQGLFCVDENYQVYPILCDTYNVSADMKTYTFYLVDAVFSDGTKVTANDVVTSLNAAMGSPWYGGRLQHAQSINAYGDAVVIELNTPMDNLPILLDIPVVKAAQVAISNPTGSGPYRLDLSGSSAKLQRQAAWWCSAKLPVYGDTITLSAATQTSQIRDSFIFDKTSLVCSDPGSDRHMDFHRDYELWDCENGQFLYLVCNEKSEIFQNPDLRRALTHAIDREMLAETYYHGFASAAQLPASPDSPWYVSQLAERYGYDPQKFADAVRDAALESNEITLLLNGDDIVRFWVGQAVANMLTAGGLKVTIVESTSEKLRDDLLYSAYDLYLGQTRLSNNMDISAFFGSKTSLNYGGLADPAIHAMSLEALANEGNYYKLHELVMEEGQLCPILFQNYAIYTQRGVLPELSPARDAIFFYTVGRTLDDALINRD